MTLLDEYQALPGEPERAPVDATMEGLYARIRMMQGQRIRRDAVIRLLCRALRQYGRHSTECTLANKKREEGAGTTKYNRCECGYGSLLTAVERDFPEGV